MTLAADLGRPGLVSRRAVSDRAVWLAVALGGFVMFEPAPYELFLAALIPLYFIAGLPIRRSFAPLLVLFLIYCVGGLLSTTQNAPIRFQQGLIYMAVTLFLALSSVWFAALVADDWRRIRVIEQASVWSGCLVAAIGVLGYFRLLPNSEALLLYDRARGTFEDPNVFGPFLLLPALILGRRLMVGSIIGQLGSLAGLLILVLGVFLSFSRAAWGMMALGLPLLAAVVSATAPRNRDRLRLLAIATAGLALLVLLLAVAASIPAVQELLVQRAQLVQEYDGKSGSELGRFARHWVGFAMATELPLGIGPFEFPALFVEATHNSYLKALMEYGWLGFVAYVALVVWTLARGIPLMWSPRPWQPLAQCLVVSLVLHLVVGWVIDTDHWRHFYMTIGLIWGLVAAEALQRRTRGLRATT